MMSSDHDAHLSTTDPIDLSGRTTRPKAPASARAVVGTCIGGRYDVLALLGAGAMARVYEAGDRVTGRTVAVKLATDLLPDAEASKRMRVEARALRATHHPNVLRYIDCFDDEEARTVLVVERLRGGTLDQRVAVGAVLAADEAVRIFAPVAAGLAAVHDAGYVHRDLKPQNVFVGDGGPRDVKLIDFGLARAAHQNITLTFTVVGTPAYVAPEQAVGDVVGPSADLYALGITMYRTLTGRLPFDGADLRETLVSHLRSLAPSPREVRADVDPALDDLVMRLLAKQPEERPASAHEVAIELMALQAHLERGTRPPPPAPRSMAPRYEPRSAVARCVVDMLRAEPADG